MLWSDIRGTRAFAEASRGVRVVFAGYGRCMGGECVVFAGWPAYGGRAFAEASLAGYGRCLGGFAGWPAHGGRAFAEASRGVRVVFAGYGRCMGGE